MKGNGKSIVRKSITKKWISENTYLTVCLGTRYKIWFTLWPFNSIIWPPLNHCKVAHIWNSLVFPDLLRELSKPADPPPSLSKFHLHSRCEKSRELASHGLGPSHLPGWRWLFASCWGWSSCCSSGSLVWPSPPTLRQGPVRQTLSLSGSTGDTKGHRVQQTTLAEQRAAIHNNIFWLSCVSLKIWVDLQLWCFHSQQFHLLLEDGCRNKNTIGGFESNKMILEKTHLHFFLCIAAPRQSK